VPHRGRWREILCSDEGSFGGSGHPRRGRAVAEAVPCHGEDQSLSLVLPPLCALVLEREPAV